VSFTDAFEIDVLKAITAQVTAILPTGNVAAVWVGLSTTTPSDSVAGTPPSGGSYARVNATGLFAVPSAGSVANNAVITFPTATADWGTVTHAELFDAATAGNRLAWAALGTSKPVPLGDTASIASGQLVITLN
jgi:hypothetical protein